MIQRNDYEEKDCEGKCWQLLLFLSNYSTEIYPRLSASADLLLFVGIGIGLSFVTFSSKSFQEYYCQNIIVIISTHIFW